ncbi:MAG: DNA polymerase III subunit gamma/tau C-terminal domain-containing protein, partial [Lysobacter spongiicola]|nr:DNA polymerase III subunit gamma/tau C-terminal domain-containing protein [Lysobacter spongiicola]
VPAELVQLWYQMALHGRRDLPLAPSPRSGFEMTVLRMLAFRPAGEGGAHAAPPAASRGAGQGSIKATAPAAAEAPTSEAASRAAVEAREEVPASKAAAKPGPGPEPEPEPEPERVPQVQAAEQVASPPSVLSSTPVPVPEGGTGLIADADDWHSWVTSSGLKGPVRVLAEHCGFVACSGGELVLALSPEDELLRKPALVEQIAKALEGVFGGAPRLRFEEADGAGDSVRERNQRARDDRQAKAEQVFMNDPQVQHLIQQHGAKLVPDSIRPLDDH